VIELSIVIPVYNEEGVIAPLTEEIVQVLGEDRERFEVIFVNDGSTDKTELVLDKLHERYPVVRVINFVRNAGQSAAMICGFRHARGKHVVSLDGDGQNDPRDIPRIVELLEKYQVVCGIRARRQDSHAKRLGPSSPDLFVKGIGGQHYGYWLFSKRVSQGSVAKALFF